MYTHTHFPFHMPLYLFDHIMCMLQSCPTLRDPMDCSLPGSSVHGILQARILEWVGGPPPGDLPDLGIESESLYVYCIGRKVLYLYCHLGSPFDHTTLLYFFFPPITLDILQNSFWRGLLSEIYLDHAFISFRSLIKYHLIVKAYPYHLI